MKIIFASGNAHKINEVRTIFAKELPAIELLAQRDCGVSAETAETGATFVENAILKARHAALITGLPVMADDSGLCVDALGGRPGINSARYAGEKADGGQNIAKLLAEMQPISPEKRTARFHSVIVYLRHVADPLPIICQGTWEGMILTASRGKSAFGYEPIFFLPENNQTVAEMSLAQKNTLSHRARAVYALCAVLKKRMDLRC